MVKDKTENKAKRFLFDEVMEDAATQQEALSIILGRDISLVGQGQTEKELRVSPLARSIRMDMFAVDEESIVYNTEMQNRRKDDLVKRSRYYQGILDTSLLEVGVPDYNSLNQTYLIMIMTFDLFGLGKYCYTFVPLRYNNDKQKKPYFSRGPRVCRCLFNSFSSFERQQKNVE